MYVAGFIIPVSEGQKAAYRRWAEKSAQLLRELGCLEIVESWEDNVPDGQSTDFRRAVDAKPGEKIVFSWQIWPDRASVDTAEAQMRDDDRFDVPGDIPFDSRRLILGGFEPICTMGRKETGSAAAGESSSSATP